MGLFKRKKTADLDLAKEWTGAMGGPDLQSSLTAMSRLLRTRGKDLQELGVPVDEFKPVILENLKDLGKESEAEGYTESSKAAGEKPAVESGMERFIRGNELTSTGMGETAEPIYDPLAAGYKDLNAKADFLWGHLAPSAAQRARLTREGTRGPLRQETPDEVEQRETEDAARGRGDMAARSAITNKILGQVAPGVAHGLFNLARGVLEFPAELGRSMSPGGDVNTAGEAVDKLNPLTSVAEYLGDVAGSDPEGLTPGAVGKRFVQDPAAGTEMAGMAATAGGLAHGGVALKRRFLESRAAKAARLAEQTEALRVEAEAAAAKAREEESARQAAVVAEREALRKTQLDKATAQDATQTPPQRAAPAVPTAADIRAQVAANAAQRAQLKADARKAAAEAPPAAPYGPQVGPEVQFPEADEPAPLTPKPSGKPTPPAATRNQIGIADALAEEAEAPEPPPLGPAVGPEVQFLGEDEPAPLSPKSRGGPTPPAKAKNQIGVADALSEPAELSDAFGPAPAAVAEAQAPPKPITGGKKPAKAAAPTEYGLHKSNVIKEIHGAMKSDEIPPKLANALIEKVRTIKDTDTIRAWAKSLPKEIRARLTAKNLAMAGLLGGAEIYRRLNAQHRDDLNTGLQAAAVFGLLGASPAHAATKMLAAEARSIGARDRLTRMTPPAEQPVGLSPATRRARLQPLLHPPPKEAIPLQPAPGPGALEQLRAGAGGITTRAYRESGITRFATQLQERLITMYRAMEDAVGGRGYLDGLDRWFHEAGPGTWDIPRKVATGKPLTPTEREIYTHHKPFLDDAVEAVKTFQEATGYVPADETANPVRALRDHMREVAEGVKKATALPPLKELLKKYEAAEDTTGVDMVTDFINHRINNMPSAWDVRAARSLQNKARSYAPAVGDAFKATGRRGVTKGTVRVEAPVTGPGGKQLVSPDRGPMWRISVDEGSGPVEWPSSFSSKELGMMKLDGGFAGGIRASSRPLSKIVGGLNTAASWKVIWGAPRVVVSQILDNPSRLVSGAANMDEVGRASKLGAQAARDHTLGREDSVTRELEAMGIFDEAPDPRHRQGAAVRAARAAGYGVLQGLEKTFSATAYLSSKEALTRQHPEWTPERIRQEAAIMSHRISDSLNPALAGGWSYHPAFQLVGYLGQAGIRSMEHFVRLLGEARGSGEGKARLGKYMATKLAIPAAIVAALGLEKDDGLELFMKELPFVGWFTNSAMEALKDAGMIKHPEKRALGWGSGGEARLPQRGLEIMGQEVMSTGRLFKRTLQGKATRADVLNALPFGKGFIQLGEDIQNYVNGDREAEKVGFWRRMVLPTARKAKRK